MQLSGAIIVASDENMVQQYHRRKKEQKRGYKKDKDKNYAVNYKRLKNTRRTLVGTDHLSPPRDLLTRLLKCIQPLFVPASWVRALTNQRSEQWILMVTGG